MTIQNIGIMMTYNEVDIITEVMDGVSKYFDKVFVLDGSNDGTTEIIQSYPCVVYLIHDKDLYPKRKIHDGVRQFLLEKAQEMYPIEGWFTLLHGDEIFVDDPNKIAEKAEKSGAEIVNWHPLNFFLHTSEKGKVIDLSKPIQDQVLHYSPGGLEVRQFKNKKNIYYNINKTGRVHPYGIKEKPLLDYPILKHYVIRGPQQFENKEKLWTKHIKDEQGQKKIFYDQINRFSKQVRVYDGSFNEFEPSNRPSFFIQYLNWHKYRKVDWGILKPILRLFSKGKSRKG